MATLNTLYTNFHQDDDDSKPNSENEGNDDDRKTSIISGHNHKSLKGPKNDEENKDQMEHHSPEARTLFYLNKQILYVVS